MSARATRRWIMLLVGLQIAVIVLMPLLAGVRMPSGTTVVLRADLGEHPEDYEDAPRQELWLEYDFDELDVPDEATSGDEVYIELVGDPDGDQPMRFGRVLADEADLEDGMTWITLGVDGRDRIDPGPIQVWYEDDVDQVDELRAHAEAGGELKVRVDLDNDGSPTISDVEQG